MRPMLRPEDDGKFAARDVQAADYELDEDDYGAVTPLRKSFQPGRVAMRQGWCDRNPRHGPEP